MPPSSQAAYQSLTAFKPRSSQDVLAEAENKYDVGGARTRVSSLRGLVGNLQSSVEAVDPSVTGRTSGTFTTEGQRQALVSKERAPILGDLSKQQGYLGEEQQNFNTSQGLATQMASALLSDDKQAYQRLLDQYNAATAAEQAAEQKRQYEASQAEQARQFNEQLKATKAASGAGGAGGYDVGSIIDAINKGSGSTKDYIGNNDFRGRLAFLAKNGDKNAAVALKYAGNNNRYDGSVASQAEFNALKAVGVQGNYKVAGSGSGKGW